MRECVKVVEKNFRQHKNSRSSVIVSVNSFVLGWRLNLHEKSISPTSNETNSGNFCFPSSECVVFAQFFQTSSRFFKDTLLIRYNSFIALSGIKSGSFMHYMMQF